MNTSILTALEAAYVTLTDRRTALWLKVQSERFAGRRVRIDETNLAQFDAKALEIARQIAQGYGFPIDDLDDDEPMF